PVSPVNDLVVKNSDLVIATHGRSFWVLDNISPLRLYQDAIAQEDVHLFTPVTTNHSVFRGGFFGSGANTGKNPPAGAVIDYWLKEEIKSAHEAKKSETGAAKEGKEGAGKSEEASKEEQAPKITLDVLDSSGKVIRHFPKKRERPVEADEGGGDD